MSWTAEIISKDFASGMVLVDVLFVDLAAGGKFKESIRSTAPSGNWPASEIDRRLEQLNAVDLGKIALGPYQKQPPPDPGDPPAPSAQDVFFANFIKLRRLREVVTLNVIAADDKLVTDLEALTKSQFKPEYFG